MHGHPSVGVSGKAFLSGYILNRGPNEARKQNYVNIWEKTNPGRRNEIGMCEKWQKDECA